MRGPGHGHVARRVALLRASGVGRDGAPAPDLGPAGVVPHADPRVRPPGPGGVRGWHVCVLRGDGRAWVLP